MNLVNCEKARPDTCVYENFRMNMLLEKVTHTQALKYFIGPETFMIIAALGSGVHFFGRNHTRARNSHTLLTFHYQSWGIQPRNNKQCLKYNIKFKSTASWGKKWMTTALHPFRGQGSYSPRLSVLAVTPVSKPLDKCSHPLIQLFPSSLSADPLESLARWIFMNGAFSVKCKA